jgi:hypothetical protein
MEEEIRQLCVDDEAGSDNHMNVPFANHHITSASKFDGLKIAARFITDDSGYRFSAETSRNKPCRCGNDFKQQSPG